MIEYIRSSVIGDGVVIQTPYGPHRMTYADYTASGRALSFVEDYVRQHVLPTYGNTHTSSSAVGVNTDALRESARSAIAAACHATKEDVVIFCGSGATGAIDRLMRCMGLSRSCNDFTGNEAPVIFIGPYEHHSVELQAKEAFAEVVQIEACQNGLIDLDDLEAKLSQYSGSRLKIGMFSAGSNVTGILSDVPRIAETLHDYGALAFFDYAAAGPYVAIDMNPVAEPLCYLDAVFLSPHKFPGGPGASGVLIAKKKLFSNAVPAVPGGGTVSYADSHRHVYLPGIQAREEGGTPNIVGDIRAGLVFQLKSAVGVDVIHNQESGFAKRAIAAWSQDPNIIILGNTGVERMATISFLVKFGDLALHHGFVTALLNDLFGIQARGGCSCAAPYGHRLLGIDDSTAKMIEEQVARDSDGNALGQGIRPGWCRLSFSYYDSEEMFQYVIQAVLLLAKDGWRALVDYTMDPCTGKWSHNGKGPMPPTIDLLKPPPLVPSLPESVFGEQLHAAQAILGGCSGRCSQVVPVATSDAFSEMRWFWLPQEIIQFLRPT